MARETPFSFGKIASGDNFTNRSYEVQELTQNFSSLINTIIISPRRWGKSSLVQEAARQVMEQDEDLRICKIDLYNVRTESDFYRLLAERIIGATNTRMDDIMADVKQFFKQLVPRLSYQPHEDMNFSLSFDWEELNKHPEEVLNLAEAVAKQKGVKLVICIDEFQQIANFDKPLDFQEMLRANWQQHQHVSYCLYGSKRHMLMDVFTDTNMPFFQFGQLMFLDKINRHEWVEFITKRFRETGKLITNKRASDIALFCDNHPYYVQQLAQQCWLRSRDTCTEAVVDEACDHLLMQMSLLFQRQTDNLTTPQINYLRAIVDGVAQLSSAETVNAYQLGTSANVARMKGALRDKEVIDTFEEEITFMDPMYRHWLERYYFV